MTHRIFRIICGLLISLGAIAQETTMVQLEDTGEALINPGMGWTIHFYSNVARNYGSKLEPSDTLEDFPGVSTVSLRLPWAYLEPEEGKYNWAIYAPTTKPGTYDLDISVGQRYGTPTIAMALKEDDGQRRYKIGQITLKP